MKHVYTVWERTANGTTDVLIDIFASPGPAMDSARRRAHEYITDMTKALPKCESTRWSVKQDGQRFNVLWHDGDVMVSYYMQVRPLLEENAVDALSRVVRVPPIG